MKQINPKLTEDQKDVLFNKATEAPYSGLFLYNEEYGDYNCANCGSVVFGAETKFDSGCGWPSFYDVADTKAIKLVEDKSHGMVRVEVTCANCGGHLGHVFNDAPDQPTGMRFCINSLSLDFEKK
ncbi:MAG: peptide-methionine (R)-S-oxide reductase MsrB [Candidatus Saccharibacteria bacterium]|nr:peptide-methionine (R)-S-oxide reductase MsrB [Candidatus Saccharibacteria bacterium]